MCLITDWKTPHIAEEDIICYKVYEDSWNGYASPYIGSPIPKFNKITHVDCFQEKIVKNQCHHGFHSFKNRKDNRFIPDIICNTRVFECIIPKGTKYYEGRFNCIPSYCSESIIIEEPVNNFNYYKRNILNN